MTRKKLFIEEVLGLEIGERYCKNCGADLLPDPTDCGLCVDCQEVDYCDNCGAELPEDSGLTQCENCISDDRYNN